MTKVPTTLAAAALVLTALAGAPAPASAQTGSIRGSVVVPPPPPARRTPPGYRNDSRPLQPLPTLVWLVGRFEGVAAGGSAPRVEMVQQDTLFRPAAAFVPIGGSVVFPNGDPFFHNVFSFSNARRFDLGRYARGESKEVRFEEPGLVEVLCEVHDHMQAVIVVTENPFHASLAERDTFLLDGVPAGEHTLAVWHPSHGVVERTVVVRAGAETRVEVALR